VARFTRKELKKDAFAEEVSQTVEFLGEHRKQVVRYGTAALVIVVLAGGYYYYNKWQAGKRHQALAAAIRIQEAPVVPSAGNTAMRTFPTQEAKQQAASKAFTELTEKYPGTEEGTIARYFLGTMAIDDGRLNHAETFLKEAAGSKDANYASLAKLALAQVYQAQGKTAEGEALLRSLIEKPTLFVSKTQATIALARMLVSSKPDEARKLLEPLRLEAGPAARAAFSILNQLPNKS
jgi:predicted negative regulator of RcsB-dependent stress response